MVQSFRRLAECAEVFAGESPALQHLCRRDACAIIRARLAEKFVDHVAVADDHHGPSGRRAIFLVEVDAEAVVERRGHVVGAEARSFGLEAEASVAPITCPPLMPPPAINANIAGASGRDPRPY